MCRSRKLWLALLTVLCGLSKVYALDATNVASVRDQYMKGVIALGAARLDIAANAFYPVSAIPITAQTPEPVRTYVYRSLYFLGDISFVKGDYASAVRLYRSFVMGTQPEGQNLDYYAKALYKLGRTLVIHGEKSKRQTATEQGITVLNEYLAKYAGIYQMGDNATYWVGRGYVYLNRFSDAVAILSGLQEDYPGSPLLFDVQKLLDSLRAAISEAERQAKAAGVSLQEQLDARNQANTEQAQQIAEQMDVLAKRNRDLLKERTILEQMQRLLEMKQRLLQVKQAKLRQLSGLEGIY